MAVIGAIRRRLLLLARSERGMAVPVALFALIASFALASAAVMSSVDVQRGSARDHDAKEAIAAADAGANLALLRLNRFQSSLTSATPCVSAAGVLEEADPANPGWCRPTTPEGVSENSEFTYRVSAYDGTGVLSVVATGTSDIVSRRVKVGMRASSGTYVFPNERLIGEDEIVVGGNPRIETDVGTNGSVTGNGTPIICGNIRKGIGKDAPTPSCGKKVTEGQQNLPPIAVPSNIATVNSNCRLEATCPDKTAELDTYTKESNGKNGKISNARTSKEPWESPSTINVATQGATLSMGGTDYFVCNIDLQGGTMIMPAGANIRIFVDTPEHCGLPDGATQVDIGANATIKSTGLIPEEGTYNVPSIYLLGPGAVKLAGTPGSTNEVMIYAPDSEIEIKGNVTWVGMIAGKKIVIQGNPTIQSNPKIKVPEESFATLLERTRYVECTGGVGATPDADC
jgi:hypothetical protein